MDEKIHYIVEHAAHVVHENIGRLLQIKFPVDSIIQILDIEFEYQQKKGLTDDKKELCGYPMPVNGEEMNAFIMQQCQKSGITIRKDELDEILDKENIYLKMIGAIDEENGSSYYN